MRTPQVSRRVSSRFWELAQAGAFEKTLARALVDRSAQALEDAPAKAFAKALEDAPAGAFAKTLVKAPVDMSVHAFEYAFAEACAKTLEGPGVRLPVQASATTCAAASGRLPAAAVPPSQIATQTGA